LKPLCGSAPWLYNCLASYCRLDYPSYELLCCTGCADDPAVDVVHRLQRDFPLVDVKLFVADQQHGPNAKMDNLDKMHRESRYDILVISDDDIVAPPDYWHIHELGTYAAWAQKSIGSIERTWLTCVPPWVHFRNVCYQIRTADALGFHHRRRQGQPLRDRAGVKRRISR